ncbi:MAG: CRISPR-associated endonuclease Cas2 [Bdellovibrionota bacterium]
MRSAYKAMWLFIFFDLPTLSAEQRKFHTKFRKNLQKMGFMRAQLSVYINHFSSEEATLSIRKKIKNLLPAEGQVRILLVTDRQFGKMEILDAKILLENETPLPQVLLF